MVTSYSSARLGQNCQRFGQIGASWPCFVEIWPNFDQYWPNAAKARPLLAKCDECWSEFGQCWHALAEMGLKIGTENPFGASCGSISRPRGESSRHTFCTFRFSGVSRTVRLCGIAARRPADAAVSPALARTNSAHAAGGARPCVVPSARVASSAAATPPVRVAAAWGSGAGWLIACSS